MFNWISKGIRLLYVRYKKQARNRGLAFELNEVVFTYIVTSEECFYCKCRPYQTTYGEKYLGIDRMNNYIGYTITNCVQCCGKCNKLKGAKSVEEFIEFLKLRNNNG